MNDKVKKYEQLIKQAEALVANESNSLANMANFCALINENFGWLWVGFYLVETKENQLILGPFQGPIACTRIAFGKGVCGEAWKYAKTQIVPDVHAHPNHIACSSLPQSEIVVPIKDKNGTVIAVLDIDSEVLDSFDNQDAAYLENLVSLLR